MYWEMSSDEDSDDDIKHLLKSAHITTDKRSIHVRYRSGSLKTLICNNVKHSFITFFQS